MIIVVKIGYGSWMNHSGLFRVSIMGWCILGMTWVSKSVSGSSWGQDVIERIDYL